MASYRIEWKPRARREFRALDTTTRTRLLPHIEALAQNPRPTGAVRLSGQSASFRIRAGDYRIVYTIEDAALIIEIVRVGHRREVYRHLG